MDINISQPVQLHEDLKDVELWHEGRILLIDKPLDWTSFDLVNRIKMSIRHGLQVKKIKIGHAGTLDPKATGLMILLTGKYTKLTDRIHTYDKTYEAVFCLGATTPCYDTEREIDAHYPVDHITEDHIHEISARYVGVIDQIPPIFSAVKINGRSAYKSAHKGLHVVTRSRQVTVYQLQVTKVNMPYVHLVVRCSTGTYIRTLVHDIGKALQSGAYLSSLKRVAIGPWELSQALAIQDLADKIKNYQAPVTESVSMI